MRNTEPSECSPVLKLIGSGLTCETLTAAAATKTKVSIPDTTWEIISRGRYVIEKIAKDGRPAYGITTGVGSQKDFHVSADTVSEYNRRLAKAHATHVSGPNLSKNRVRGTLIILANEFSLGLSGVSPALVSLIIDQVNNGEMPKITANGTVGASDLVPMSQLANWLFTLPEAQKAGVPGAKETLSVINCNAVTLATGAEVLIETKRLSNICDLSLAISLEAFRANLDAISTPVNKAHKRNGQAKVSTHLRSLLNGSKLWEAGAARRIQDPLSFRCASQIHGALRELLDRAESVWNEELNSVNDNPIVDFDAESVRSHGNMDSTRMTLALDGVRQALAKTMDISGERLQKQQWTSFSDLPTGLAGNSGPIGGVQFLNLGHIAASFITSIKIWAAPSLLLSVGQVADGVEDTASHSFHTIADLERIVEAAWRVIAIEIIISVWAIHRRKLPVSELGSGVQKCYNAVAPMLPIDREGIDIFSIDPIVEALQKLSFENIV